MVPAAHSSYRIRSIMADEITTELVEEHIDTQLCGALVNTNGPAMAPVQETFVINGTNLINKAVNLANTPASALTIRVIIIGAIPQVYGVDYIVIGSSINWNGYDLDGVLEVGDEMIVQYYMA